jgi:phenylalanyl-tRNA synthetase beta chain
MVHPKTLFDLDIKSQVFHADINWDLLLQIVKKHKIQYKPLAKFPSMRRDLALIINEGIQFHQVLNIAQKNGKSILKDVNLFDVYSNKEHLGEGKKSYAVSFIFQDENKTLVDKDVDNIMENLIQVYEKELGAFIRK